MSVVFPTCLGDLVRPRLADRVRAVLARRGVATTAVRGATCCGQPAYNAGYAADARRVARRTLLALARTEGPIVVPSGSCTAMMTHHWPALFAGTRHAAVAREVSTRVVELSQVLVRTPAPVPPTERSAGGRPEAVAYHGSCHLTRELGARDEAQRVLAADGTEVRLPARADLCCGFGGSFSVKLPGISVAMADEKLDHLTATGCTTVVGCDVSCLVHLEGRARTRDLPITFRHLAEQLDG